jgi:hypothetical protein
MKRLSKDRKQQRADLVTRLNDAAEAVRAALVTVNAEIAGKLNSAIENYNLILSVAEAFRDEIVSELEHYASDRSDRWQNSERGQIHEAWKQEWEVLDVTGLDAIDEIDEPEMAHANELESLRPQPE